MLSIQTIGCRCRHDILRLSLGSKRLSQWVSQSVNQSVSEGKDDLYVYICYASTSIWFSMLHPFACHHLTPTEINIIPVIWKQQVPESYQLLILASQKFCGSMFASNEVKQPPNFDHLELKRDLSTEWFVISIQTSLKGLYRNPDNNVSESVSDWKSDL